MCFLAYFFDKRRRAQNAGKQQTTGAAKMTDMQRMRAALLPPSEHEIADALTASTRFSTSGDYVRLEF